VGWLLPCINITQSLNGHQTDQKISLFMKRS